MEAGRQTTCPGDYLLGAPPQCCFDATVLCKWGQWRSYLTSQWGGQKLETLWSQKRVWYCHRTRHSCNFHPLTNWKAHIWCQCWSRQSAGCQSQTDVDGICVVIKKKDLPGPLALICHQKMTFDGADSFSEPSPPSSFASYLRSLWCRLKSPSGSGSSYSCGDSEYLIAGMVKKGSDYYTCLLLVILFLRGLPWRRRLPDEAGSDCLSRANSWKVSRNTASVSPMKDKATLQRAAKCQSDSFEGCWWQRSQPRQLLVSQKTARGANSMPMPYATLISHLMSLQIIRVSGTAGEVWRYTLTSQRARPNLYKDVVDWNTTLPWLVSWIWSKTTLVTHTSCISKTCFPIEMNGNAVNPFRTLVLAFKWPDFRLNIHRLELCLVFHHSYLESCIVSV